MNYAIMKRKGGEYMHRTFMGPDEESQSMAGLASNIGAELLLEGHVDLHLEFQKAVEIRKMIADAAEQANKDGHLDVRALETKIAEL